MKLGPAGLASQVTPSGCPTLLSPAGHREIHVLDTDYEHYAILRVSLQWQGKEFHVFKYLSKLCPGGGSAPPSPGLPAQIPWPHSSEPGQGG